MLFRSPEETDDQLIENGDVEAVPIFVWLAKKSTRESRFSGSDADAVTVMLAGAVKLAALAGAVMLTLGSLLPDDETTPALN